MFNDFFYMHRPMMAPDLGGAAGGGAGTGGQGGDEGKEDQSSVNGEGKQDPPAGDSIELPKTKEEFLKMLQSESDKRVTGALATAKAKWEAEYNQKLEDEKAEAAKLAKMTEAEKKQHLLDKQTTELAEKEKAIAAREMKLTKIDIFAEKKLPIKLVDYVQGDTADEVKTNIDTFEKEWRAAIDEAVNEKLKGRSPFTAGVSGKGELGVAKQLIEFNKNTNIENLQKAKEQYFK